jgi:hypothetical protein
MATTLSGSPALSQDRIDSYLGVAPAETRSMTVGGTAAKTLFFLAALVASIPVA